MQVGLLVLLLLLNFRFSLSTSILLQGSKSITEKCSLEKIFITVALNTKLVLLRNELISWGKHCLFLLESICLLEFAIHFFSFSAELVFQCGGFLFFGGLLRPP